METARRLCAGDQPKACGGGSSGANTNSNTSSGSQRSKQAGGASNLHIIRLRGLPFSATPADIKGFLAPIELPDGSNSIQMVRHPDLRPTGEAYVHLSTETEVMQALNKHKQMMGKRYIEVGPCMRPQQLASSCIAAGWLVASSTCADCICLPEGHKCTLPRRSAGDAFLHAAQGSIWQHEGQPTAQHACTMHDVPTCLRRLLYVHHQVFPSCLAELQQSMTPPRPMGYQQMDQGYTQGRTASGACVCWPGLTWGQSCLRACDTQQGSRSYALSTRLQETHPAA
jgi:hypothetical protein